MNDAAVVQQRFNRGIDIISRNFKNSNETFILQLKANVDKGLENMNAKFEASAKEQYENFPQWETQTQNQNDFFRKQGMTLCATSSRCDCGGKQRCATAQRTNFQYFF